MSIFAQPLGEARGWRLQITNPRSPAYWVQKLFSGGAETASGIRVSPEVALTMSAVFASVRILAEDIGTLPFGVYRKTPGGRTEEPDNPVETLMARKANPEISGIDFRQTIIGHGALRGNGYAEIQFDKAARPIALWPLRPDKMGVGRNGQNGVSIAAAPQGELLYLYRLPNGELKVFSRDQIFHLKGFSGDGLVGYSPVAMARQAIGLALATEEFGARFFANDARPGGVIKAAGQLSDRAMDNLEKSWTDRHQGLSNASRVAILEEGMDFAAIGIAPDEAQFLQTRQFQVLEVARWFRIAPHLLQELDRATHSNIEHQGLEHVQYTLRPWVERFEAETDTQLLVPPLYSKINMNGFLRGDMASRYTSYLQGMQGGFLNGDMIAEQEDRNPPPDGTGRDFYIPLAMIPQKAFDENGMTLQGRLESAAALVKVGFDPASVVTALKLPAGLVHTGVVPNTGPDAAPSKSSPPPLPAAGPGKGPAADTGK